MSKTNTATVLKIERQELPSLPIAFAEFVLQLYYPMHDDPQQGEVYYPGREEAEQEWALVYYKEFEKTFGEYHAAMRWLRDMPVEGCYINIDITSAQIAAARKQRELGTWLSLDYVDCECEDNYIKPARKPSQSYNATACRRCRVTFEDCPNARLTEVRKAGLYFDEHNVEVVGRPYSEYDGRGIYKSHRP